MTKEKEELLVWIKSRINKRLQAKFKKGAEEHKENLWTLDLIDEAIDELLDALVYLLAFRRKHQKD